MNGHELYFFTRRCFQRDKQSQTENIRALSLHLRFLIETLSEVSSKLLEAVGCLLNSVLESIDCDKELSDSFMQEVFVLAENIMCLDAELKLSVDLFPQQCVLSICGETCVFVGEHPNGTLGFSEDVTYLEFVLTSLKKSLADEQIQRYILGVPIYVPLVNSWAANSGQETQVLSLYDSISKALIILPDRVSSKEDLIASLGHEFGHFVYETVFEDHQRSLWGDLYKSSLTELNLIGIWNLRSRYVSDEAFEMACREKSPNVWCQIHSLFYHPTTEEFEIYDLISLCEAFRKHNLEDRNDLHLDSLIVEKEPITQYSISSEQEAFCEAFGLLLAKDFRKVCDVSETQGPRQLSSSVKQGLRALLRSVLR